MQSLHLLRASSKDNIYANDVSLTDVLELHSRLNDKEELAINISFTDTRFFTNFNRLANKSESHAAVMI